MVDETAVQTGPEWNGKDGPYDPWRRPLGISDKVVLHKDAETVTDPVQYEIISTKLWNINEDHADTIKRVSGSPIVIYNQDFNTAILDEVGGSVLFGPYIQYFAGAAEFIVKYTLEYRGESPGIEPGDIFLSNDSFLAGTHQMDVAVYAPVFVDGKLFCWVANACHVRDIGGVEPGSFCVQASDIYHDPPSVRALKIADAKNGIRSDAEDLFLRMSRVPHMLALELRSQIAGVVRARASVEELVGRYGTGAVKGVMRKIVDDTERVARERVSRLPDGRWTDVVYIGGALPGDRSLQKFVLTLEKQGDRLRFTNEGTGPEFGSINCSYGHTCCAIGSSLALMLAYDHKICLGGVLRLCEFDAVPGTLSCVSREGAMSGTVAQILLVYMGMKVISRMLYPDPELRRSIMATSAIATRGWLTHSGTDQSGRHFATATLDNCAGGIGAMSFRDGIDQGGATFWPKSEIGDCESWELYYPVIYLYRRSAANGGHGKFRGGHGMALGWVGNGSPDQVFSASTVASGVPAQSGIFGGHWGQSSLVWAAQDTRIRELFANGVIPNTRDEVRSIDERGRFVAAGETALPLQDHDVVEMSTFGGGGYGDPLDREPQAVVTDYDNGAISDRAMRTVYGVIADDSGRLDAAATDSMRESMRKARLERATFALPPADVTIPPGTEPACDVSEHLAIVEVPDEGFFFVCTNCDTALSPADENYKLHCGAIDGSLVDIDPELFTDPADEVDVPMTYRTFVCPDCGVAFENELVPVDSPPIWDVQLETASFARLRRNNLVGA